MGNNCCVKEREKDNNDSDKKSQAEKPIETKRKSKQIQNSDSK